MIAASAGRLVASCGGVGKMRPAPGTWGSALGLALFALLLADLPLSVQLVAAVVAAMIGVVASAAASRVLGDSDPSEVVIDELSGMWIALLGTTSWSAWVLAFFAFRALDIVKPFPADRLEALPGGWGIMADDWMAGAYALMVVVAARAAGLVT